jgi:uncharacterized repeat protein (TIGR01451 family)
VLLALTGSSDFVKTGAFDNDGNNDGFADAGETISFTFTVTNTGNVTLTNVTISDIVPGVVVQGGPLAELGPGEVDSTTFTASYVLTDQDIINGFFVNLASLAADSAAGALAAQAEEEVILKLRPKVVPTMSQWSMAIMALLLLVAGLRYIPVMSVRRR